MEQVDTIIVGAGSAGAVLAHRLTADGRRRVLLLEAGRPSHPYSRLPVSYGLLIDEPTANWRFRSTPEPGTANREIPVPRGKLLGGSSAINGLVYVRGQPLDFDTWAQFGNRGWSWDDVLPVFRRMEAFAQGDPAVRGRGGPLHVTEVADRNPLYDAIVAAAEQAGQRRNPDYNGLDQEGIGRTQATIARGRRMSTAVCYLDEAMRRPNLRVVTEALTHRVLLEGTRCVGVAYESGGGVVEVRAREVILCAGAICTPQILELSGIGDPDVLRAQGVAVRHALPAVGRNLRDHIAARLIWRIKVPGVSYNDRARGLGLMREIARYLASGSGFLSLPSAPLLGFFKTRPELATPDIQIHFVPYSVKDPKRRKLQTFPSMTTAVYQLRPESLGSVHIRSADPREPPAIRFNFLSDEIDRRTIVDGIRIARRIIESPAMDTYRGDEFQPGRQVERDDELIDWMRRTSETTYHPIGTCRMGPGPDSVVDATLKVHGLQGLRIADASIMPTMPSGNTNAPAVMIGEKAADLIGAESSAA
ncbi:MAG: GMC family oxidoreductase N-terminal domain-containing protein [Alphaproteobacteria bacterium]|nr:GMC family oxidoreductase N-terminal domain-containing protein [Alphaproteobacteria bacterium]